MVTSSSSSSHPAISGPKPVDIHSSTRYTSRHKAQKSSLSGTMSWLTRSSSSPVVPSQKQPYSVSKPIRISEPKFPDASSSRSIGSGVVVVKTPQEALAGSGLRNVEAARKETRSLQAEMEGVDDHPPPSFPPSQGSPPLPPVPAPRGSPNLSRELSQNPLRQIGPSHSAAPLSAPSLPKSRSPPSPEPANAPPPPQTPFDATLLSDLPPMPIDPSKTIVTLETSTQTYRTTLKTLTCRKSHLFEYFITLFNSGSTNKRDSDACSVYSQSSDIQDNLDSFNSIFHNHLAASGLLIQSTSSIHLFLDRPSAPYAHILAYLRTPPSLDHPATLPRAVQLSTGTSPSRIEALLELRDEANFLQLEELYTLCSEELKLHRQKHVPGSTTIRTNGITSGVHASKASTVSSNSSTASNLIGIEERSEDDPVPSTLLNRMPTPNSSQPSSRAGSGHEIAAGTFSHHQRMGSDVDLREVKKENYTTFRSRPPPTEWI